MIGTSISSIAFDGIEKDRGQIDVVIVLETCRLMAGGGGQSPRFCFSGALCPGCGDIEGSTGFRRSAGRG
jgi:hypothetical protein